MLVFKYFDLSLLPSQPFVQWNESRSGRTPCLCIHEKYHFKLLALQYQITSQRILKIEIVGL